MQPGFDGSTRVVDFHPTSLPYPPKNRGWFLWPAFAYKVLLPSPCGGVFNIFQRAILDMHRAGVRFQDNLASRLALPEELVSSVIRQLKYMGMLDDRGRPTEAALHQMAQDDDRRSDTDDVGYAFIDGHNGRLWPRLYRGSLPFIEADLDQDRKAKLKRGSLDKPEEVRASVLLPANSTRPLAPPSAQQLVGAAEQHQKKAQSFSELFSDRRILDEDPSQIIPERIRLVGTVPEPVLVSSFVFVPSETQPWLVTDPCGLGVSNILRDSLFRLAQNGVPTARKLIQKVTNEAWSVHKDDLAHYLEQANQRAAEQVARQLGRAAGLLPAVVLQKLADADSRLDAVDAQSRLSTNQVEQFFTNAYSAVEGTLSWVLSLYPDAAVLETMGENPRDNGRLLQRLAASLGYFTSERTLAFLTLSRAIVKGALSNGNQTLAGALAGGLLAARVQHSHPLCTLASREPNALQFFADLHKHRLAAAHNTETVLDLGQALAFRERLYQVLRALVGSAPVQVLPPKSLDWAWGADMMLRIRAQAEHKAQRHPELDRYPELRTRLIEMHCEAITIELLAHCETMTLDKIKPYLRDFAVAAAIVLESALGAIEKRTPSQREIADQISDNRQQNAVRIIDTASSLGFELTPDGSLPQDLTHARASRIRKAARGQSETLSARLIAQLFSATNHPNHPLRKLAERAPAFLLDLGLVVNLRGHGDQTRLLPEQVPDIENRVVHNLQAVLEALN